MQKKEGAALITVRFYSLLRFKLGVGSLTLEAGNVEGAMDHLEERFGPQFREQFHQFQLGGRYINGRMEDFCILLLDGHRVDRQKLRQVKLKSGDILHVFLPTAGG